MEKWKFYWQKVILIEKAVFSKEIKIKKWTCTWVVLWVPWSHFLRQYHYYITRKCSVIVRVNCNMFLLFIWGVLRIITFLALKPKNIYLESFFNSKKHMLCGCNGELPGTPQFFLNIEMTPAHCFKESVSFQCQHVF